MTPSSPSPQPAQFVTDGERAMANLWQQVLNTPELPDPLDNFFSLGGDSIAMIMAELRIKEEFAVELPAGVVLSTSSLRELVQLVAEQQVRVTGT